MKISELISQEVSMEKLPSIEAMERRLFLQQYESNETMRDSMGISVQPPVSFVISQVHRKSSIQPSIIPKISSLYDEVSMYTSDENPPPHFLHESVPLDVKNKLNELFESRYPSNPLSPSAPPSRYDGCVGTYLPGQYR